MKYSIKNYRGFIALRKLGPGTVFLRVTEYGIDIFMVCENRYYDDGVTFFQLPDPLDFVKIKCVNLSSGCILDFDWSLMVKKVKYKTTISL